MKFSRADIPMEGICRLMVFSRFSQFASFFPIPVAVTRQSCRVVATVALAGLAACAGVPAGNAPQAVSTPAVAPTTPEAKQALVRQRVAARWDLLIKGDFDAAYEFLSPGSKETTTLLRFKSNIRRDAFRAIDIQSVACDGDACLVKLNLTYDHPKMKGIVTPVSESWIVVGPQAWYVYGR